MILSTVIITIASVLCGATSNEKNTSVKISVQNFYGKELQVQHSTRGVYNPHSIPITFDSDSTLFISIHTDGIEELAMFVTDIYDRKKISIKEYILHPERLKS